MGKDGLVNFATVQAAPNGVALVSPQPQSEREILDGDRIPEGFRQFAQ